MPKKKHVVRNCRARLRPKMASIRRKIEKEFTEQVAKLEATITQRDQQLVTAGQAIIDKDKGRTLKSHIKGWWANRKEE